MRTAIASGATLLVLGALTAVAMSAGGADPASSTGATNEATTDRAPARSAPPVEVRTVVVTKVIHRTRRAKAPRRSAPAAVAAPVAASAPAPARVAQPVRVASATPAPAPIHAARSGDDHGDDSGGTDD
jgi:hypothetical protein